VRLSAKAALPSAALGKGEREIASNLFLNDFGG
jgi:hypothetical protein